jgi:hypothetical protein
MTDLTKKLLSPEMLALLDGAYKGKDKTFRVEVSEHYNSAPIYLSLYRGSNSIGSLRLLPDPTCCGSYILNMPTANRPLLMPLMLTLVEEYVRKETSRGFIFHTNNSEAIVRAMETIGWPEISRFYNPNSRHWVMVWGKAVRMPGDKRKTPEAQTLALPRQNAPIVGLGA